jgi:hypothetical protein
MGKNFCFGLQGILLPDQRLFKKCRTQLIEQSPVQGPLSTFSGIQLEIPQGILFLNRPSGTKKMCRKHWKILLI